jgi:hypothetical protein
MKRIRHLTHSPGEISLRKTFDDSGGSASLGATPEQNEELTKFQVSYR